MSVGVVIGRFQVDSLHNGHRFLIDKAMSSHKAVLIFIGCSPRQGKSDPMNFIVRERMIRAEYPSAWILPLKDAPTDEEWSGQIDTAIKDMFGATTKDVVLYGGRDSFVPHYKGIHKAIEIESDISYMSGTTLRDDIGKVVRTSADFRAGIIYHSQNTPARPVICADIAAVRPAGSHRYEVLMGRKKWDTDGWRLPGGKVDLTDTSLELAAKRELLEETDISVEGTLQYLGSDVLRDWRDGGKADVVYMVTTFLAHGPLGVPKAGSDLEELRWVPAEEVLFHSKPAHKVQMARVFNALGSIDVAT